MTRPPSRAGVSRLLGVAGLAAAVAVVGVAWHVGRDGPGADASDPELVARGEVVYAEHCATCHGKDLEGEPDWQRRRSDGTLPAPPHDATGHTWHHSDELLFRLTRDGPGAVAGDDYRTTMPAYAGILSDREIWAVLAYIKSRWPEDVRRAQSQH